MPKENNCRTTRYRHAGLVAIIILTATLYIAEFLTPGPIFEVTSFSLNYAVSLPFLLLCAIADYGIALLTGKRIFHKLNGIVRMGSKAVLVVLSSLLLVILGNLPFIPDLHEFVHTASFWKSVAAASLLNFLMLAAIEFLLQMIRNRNLQKENAVLKYAQLKSQINPHFLFNSLNVLVSLIYKDQEKAAHYTRRLSSVYRYVLTQDLHDTVPLGEEIGFINDYISILKARFDKGLEFRFDILPEDISRAIPPMSLQILVENAVKHNAILPENPLTINISTDGHTVNVSNTIRPRISRNEGTGIGLKNLSRKYAILSGENITIIKDPETFTVKLPLL